MVMKKDFKAIAGIIRSEYTRYDNTGENDYEGKHATTNIGLGLVEYFAGQNPKFNRQKFLDACGL